MQHQADYDVIFTDIRLEDGLCFEAFAGVEVVVPLVFTTAYDEFALQAIKVGGVDYLLKPIDEVELQQALVRVKRIRGVSDELAAFLKRMTPKPAITYSSRLLVNCFDGSRVVRIVDISHFLFNERKTWGYLSDGTVCQLSDKSLDVLAERLDPATFFRANRQCIVNIDCIKHIHASFRQTGELELYHFPKLRIKISKEKLAQIRHIVEGV